MSGRERNENPLLFFSFVHNGQKDNRECYLSLFVQIMWTKRLSNNANRLSLSTTSDVHLHAIRQTSLIHSCDYFRHIPSPHQWIIQGSSVSRSKLSVMGKPFSYRRVPALPSTPPSIRMTRYKPSHLTQQSLLTTDHLNTNALRLGVTASDGKQDKHTLYWHNWFRHLLKLYTNPILTDRLQDTSEAPYFSVSSIIHMPLHST